ncbi:MAG: VWA domain-containing protein [bacterium]
MEKYVKIINIIDKSGSMGSMIDTAINGFNEFLIEQQKVDGEAIVTTVLFSNRYVKLYENVDIKECYLLDKNNYTTDGMTALYDAIGKTIQDELNLLGNLPKEERPEKYLCVILTDGYENSSKEYNREKIKDMITEMRKDFNWEFIFLAADESASTEAQSIGISRGNSYAFANSADGLKDAYKGVSHATMSYRSRSVNDTVFDLMDEYKKTKKSE